MLSETQTIRALDQRQCFAPSPEGNIQFSHVKVLFRLGDQTCCGHVMKRDKREDFQLNEIKNVTVIPPECYRPLPPPSTTMIDFPSVRYHLKQPSLMNFAEGSDFSEPILREIEICEQLSRHPHPNIARYVGCQVADGRILGICFEQYPVTLMEKVNPKGLNKATFVQFRTLSQQTAERYLLGIEAGIEHLHSLGIVHNDLNPCNVMISEDDVAVIIDFDSCVRIGRPVEASKIKRTHGWYDPRFGVDDVNNDLAALQELRVWLQSDSPKGFRYRDT